jgi:hypothetical protein
MPTTLASELGFVVAILGFYCMELSKESGTRFCSWLATSIQSNVTFKATVLNMLLSPHHPLPPPPLRRASTQNGTVTKPFVTNLLTIGSDVVLQMGSPALMSYLMVHHFKGAIFPILHQLLSSSSSRDLTLTMFVGCCPQYTNLTANNILHLLIEELESISAVANKYLWDSMPPLLNMVLHLLAKGCEPDHDMLISSLTSCLRINKEVHPLLRQILAKIPAKPQTNWIELQLNLIEYVTTLTDALQHIKLFLQLLKSKSLPVDSILMIAQVHTNIWNLRHQYPNSIELMNLLDDLFESCIQQTSEETDFILDHFKETFPRENLKNHEFIPHLALFLTRVTNSRNPAAYKFADQILPCFDKDDVPTFWAVVKCLLEELPTNNWTLGAFIEIASTVEAPIKYRKQALKKIRNASSCLNAPQVTRLINVILRGVSIPWMKEMLASILFAVHPQTMKEISEHTAELLQLQVLNPIFSSTFLCVTSLVPYKLYPEGFATFKRQVMRAAHKGFFRQQHFLLVLDRSDLISLKEMQMIFSMSSSFSIHPNLFASTLALQFYCAWECARYCTLTRFKTPFGAPKQTLIAIEQFILKEWPISFLLFEALERWITASLHGTSLGTIPIVPKAAQQFFSSNSHYILEWLARLRKHVSQTAGAHQFCGLAVHAGIEVCNSAINSGREINLDVNELSLYLSKFGWGDSVLGLQKHFKCYQEVALLAKGKVENLRAQTSKPDFLVLSYLVLSDYPGLAQFSESKLETLPNLSENYSKLIFDVCSHWDELTTPMHDSPNSVQQSRVVSEIVEPFLFASPLSRLTSSIFDCRAVQAVSQIKTSLPLETSIFLPCDTQEILHAPNSPTIDGLVSYLIKLNRRIGNMKVCKELLRYQPSEIQQFKLDIAEEKVIPAQILCSHPLNLAKLLMKDRMKLGGAELVEVYQNIMPILNRELQGDLASIRSLFLTLPSCNEPETEAIPNIDNVLYMLLMTASENEYLNPKPWKALGNFAFSRGTRFAAQSQPKDTKQSFDVIAAAAWTKHLQLVTDSSYKSQMVALNLLEMCITASDEFLNCEHLDVRNSNPHVWEFFVPQLIPLVNSINERLSHFAKTILTQIAQSIPSCCVYAILAESRAVASPERYISILDKFESQALINTTRVVVDHSLRLTVLWEEYWYHDLCRLQSQVLKQELTLTQALETLRHMCADYLNFPGNTHEIWFASHFKRSIVAAVECLQKHLSHESSTGSINGVNTQVLPSSKADLKVIWKPFTTLCHKFGSVVNRTRNLKLDDLSLLLDLDLTASFLPGTKIRIQSVESRFLVLPTKTKPKKITFICEFGNSHHYLLKGHEDLRLDQRLMQVVQATNCIFEGNAKAGVPLTAGILFQDCFSRKSNSCNKPARRSTLVPRVVRDYAIVPLGRKAGFIQWVDAISLYTLCKQYYMATHELKPPPKPSVLFETELRKKISIPGSTIALRQSASLDILKETFRCLCNSTDASFLKYELLLSSVSSLHYVNKHRLFAQSVAAMSVIGYILGLGDRHLDNVLLDPTNGQIVHIDYNVCFERGHYLRVPERVPFRLTRIFTEALGPVGLSGSFTETAVTVMTLLREHSNYISLLLKSLILDNQVDLGTEGNSSSDKILKSPSLDFNDQSALPMASSLELAVNEAIDAGNELFSADQVSEVSLLSSPEENFSGKLYSNTSKSSSSNDPYLVIKNQGENQLGWDIFQNLKNRLNGLDANSLNVVSPEDQVFHIFVSLHVKSLLLSWK